MGPALRPPGPASWLETGQLRLGQKPSPGGLPPVLPSVGTGRTGLRVCRNVGHLLAPQPHGSEPHGVRGPLIAGCRCPVVVKGLFGILQATEAAWALESPRG